MSKQKISLLLEKYHKQTCTPQELELLHHYFNSFQDASSVWESSADLSKERIKASIRRTLDERLLTLDQEQKKRGKYLWRVAASVVVLIGVVLKIHTDSLTKDNKPVDVAFVRVTTSNTQMLKKHLPDGSVVHLAPNTTITYDSLGFLHSRNLSISGQAFFEVEKNPQSPFSVQYDGATVTVLGTKFNVNTHIEKSSVVAVLEGKVAVSHGSHSDTLLLNEQLKLLAGHAEKTSVDPFYLNWYQKKLVFKGNTLSEAASMLADLYGAEIRLEVKNSQEYTVAAEFPLSSAEVAVKNLCYILVLQYEKTGPNQFTIRSSNN